MFIHIKDESIRPHLVIATGQYGTSYHLVRSNRKPSIDEARDIALKTGALEEDVITIEGLCCDQVHICNVQILKK